MAYMLKRMCLFFYVFRGTFKTSWFVRFLGIVVHPLTGLARKTDCPCTPEALAAGTNLILGTGPYISFLASLGAKGIATRNKCIASSNKCLTSSNKKLLGTSATLVGAGATLVVTSALLVVTRSY